MMHPILKQVLALLTRSPMQKSVEQVNVLAVKDDEIVQLPMHHFIGGHTIASEMIPSVEMVPQIGEAIPAPYDDTALRREMGELRGAFNDMRQSVSQHPVLNVEDYPVAHPTFRPDESVAVGLGALADGAIDRENVAVGMSAAAGLEGSGVVAVGSHAAFGYRGELTHVTAVGHNALANGEGDLSNVTAIGANAHATGNDQIVLGDHACHLTLNTSYHRRQDLRDMHEVKPIELGLDFLLQLKPIQYRENLRDSYRTLEQRPEVPAPLRDEPMPPTLEVSHPAYQHQLIAYRCDKQAWDREVKQYALDLQAYQREFHEWARNNSLATIEAGTGMARKRLHYGLSGQDLEALSKKLDIDFGLFQNHEINGGEPVYSVADPELIPILINCVIQLHQQLHSRETSERIASDVLEMITSPAPAPSNDVVVVPFVMEGHKEA